MLKNLLIYRWMLANIAIVALLAIPTMAGYTTALFLQDTSFISHGIAALFLAAMAVNLRECVRLGSMRNALGQGRRSATDSDVIYFSQNKMLAKQRWLLDMPEWLATLGLLGTVIGFREAISALDLASIMSSSDYKIDFGTLLAGMLIALNTTIIGGVCGLWLMLNNRMMRTAADCYWLDCGKP